MNDMTDLAALAQETAGGFWQGLFGDHLMSWAPIITIAVIVVGTVVGEKIFGFKVADKKTRRRARERRKIVLGKYERD